VYGKQKYLHSSSRLHPYFSNAEKSMYPVFDSGEASWAGRLLKGLGNAIVQLSFDAGQHVEGVDKKETYM
jgi:hypothetical protein